MNKVFFKGLNELRAIAAFAVVVHHIELYKNRDGYSSLFGTPFENFIMALGQYGVYLFYVLSGFLITFLLLVEVKNYGHINFRNFYMRRLLKIWPLYYLLLVLTLFGFPWLVDQLPFLHKQTYYVSLAYHHYDHWQLKLITFILFLPNLAILLYKPVAGFSHSKSVGVEEQFYLFWPLLLQFFHKRLFVLLISVIFLRFLILSGMSYLLARYPSEWFKILHHFFVDFKIELMAIGGLIAYFRFHHWPSVQRFIFHKGISIIMSLIIVASIFFKVGSFTIGMEFALLILLTINDKSNIFNSKLLDFFGKISYGIYMYHPILMFFTFMMAYEFDLIKTSVTIFNIFIYILTFGLTILVSWLSYKYFEVPFLRFKDKFTVVQSGNNTDHI